MNGLILRFLFLKMVRFVMSSRKYHTTVYVAVLLFVLGTAWGCSGGGVDGDSSFLQGTVSSGEPYVRKFTMKSGEKVFCVAFYKDSPSSPKIGITGSGITTITYAMEQVTHNVGAKSITVTIQGGGSNSELIFPIKNNHVTIALNKDHFGQFRLGLLKVGELTLRFKDIGQMYNAAYRCMGS